MKFIILCLIFLMSCSVQPYIQKFENSNEFFLERTINRINLAGIYPYIKKIDRIIVSSIERPLNNDNPIIAVVEDRIIEKLTSAGYKVYERDPDLVNSLLKEVNNGFSFKAGNLPVTNLYPLLETKLPGATKVVSYRIEEFGFKYRPHMENRNLKVREGLARLHIRVQDAKTSALLCAETLDVLFQDNVTDEHIESSEQINYMPYAHKYPVIYKDSVKVDKFEALEPERISPFETLQMYTEPQFVLRSGAGSGFGVRYGLADQIKRFTGGLYYSSTEKNHYSVTANYDRIFNLPNMFNLTTFKLASRVGLGFTNNKLQSGFVMQIGAGIEYKLSGINIHMGWNHGLPFANAEDLWSTDYVLSISFSK